MDRANLRLAPVASARGGREVASRLGALCLGALALGVAVAATGLGADAARRPPPSSELAQEIVSKTLEAGGPSSQVRDSVLSLRRELGVRPLDGRTRVLYASVLLELAQGAGDARAAAFHARRAAALSPVTVPVVQAAALVLVRCGEEDGAVTLTRSMFGYDAPAASQLLGLLEPFLPRDRFRQAVPDEPDAWLAWSTYLARAGRDPEADSWLADGYSRWPGHLPFRKGLASKALGRKDWAALERLLPLEEDLPHGKEAASLYAYRARLKAERGDVPGARADAEEAERIGGSSISILVGDVLEASRDYDGAKASWSRALYSLPAGESARTTRLSLLVRLARLEEKRGNLGEALRAFRTVLKEDPDHEEARRRVAALTGGER